MNDRNTQIEQITALLHDAESAHARHEAEVLKGVRDEQWPEWYAQYLLDNGLSGVLQNEGTDFDAARLAAILADLDRRQRVEAPGEQWHTFYARHLLDNPFEDA